MKNIRWVPVVALAMMAGCVTEGAVEPTSRSEQSSPVEQVHIAVQQRIEKMRFQNGKELLATIQELISYRDLARGVVIEALPGADARTRANLLYVLGFIGGSEAQQAVRAYVGDGDDAVRYEAGAALLQIGDWSGVPLLIDFLSSSDRRLRFKAIQVLREKTSDDFGFDFNASEPVRSDAVARWKSWWEERRREIIYGRNAGG